MPIILIPTVITNSAAVTKAALRSFFLFIMRFVSPYEDEESWAVIRSTIAPMASSKLRSENIKGGSCMVYPRLLDIRARLISSRPPTIDPSQQLSELPILQE